jgi:hypothetical protein
MKRLILTLLTSLSLSIFSVQADKPKWAGEGGKPTDSEKEQHVEEMRDKHGDKNKGEKNKKNKDKKQKNKDGEDSDWEKARKDLEDNVRANNRGMISSQPLN